MDEIKARGRESQIHFPGHQNDTGVTRSTSAASLNKLIHHLEFAPRHQNTHVYIMGFFLIELDESQKEVFEKGRIESASLVGP